MCLLSQYLYYSQPRFTTKRYQHILQDDEENSPPIIPESPTEEEEEDTAIYPRTGSTRRSRRRSASQISEMSNLLQISTAAANVAAAANAEFNARLRRDPRSADYVESPTPLNRHYHPSGTSPTRSRRHFPENRLGEEQMTTEAEDTVPDLLSDNAVLAASAHAHPHARPRLLVQTTSEETVPVAGPSTGRQPSASPITHKRNISWDPDLRESLPHPSRTSSALLQNPSGVVSFPSRQPLPRLRDTFQHKDADEDEVEEEREVDLERGRPRVRQSQDGFQFGYTPGIGPASDHRVIEVGDEEIPEGHEGVPSSAISTSSQKTKRHSRSRTATAPVIFFGIWLLFSFTGSKEPRNRGKRTANDTS